MMMRAFIIASVSAVLVACQSLPLVPHLPKSQILTQQSQRAQTNNHKLASIYSHQEHLSGYYPLATGADAFAARSALTNMAEHTIDVQYYIWHDDEAGILMLQDLWRAAERGVLVRLLLDDFNGSSSLDRRLLAFTKHPNIAVRVVNPFIYRRHRFVNYLTSLPRINVRMHNKSMTFDNHISIIGGRNIGNEYLNNHHSNHFADLDIVLVGHVVHDIGQSFDEYWHSSLAYDIETLVRPNKNASELIERNIIESEPSRYTADSIVGDEIYQGTLPFRWTTMRFLADNVGKLDRKHRAKDDHLVHQLHQELGRPKRQFSVISSYFAPTKDGVKALVALAKDGVKISILTNSFKASDVGVVHAGYGHWRDELLSAGIKLYEVKPTATNMSEKPTTTSLHAKAFALDDDKVFIGSYNIDPRSANVNTELGVIIYDKMLAHQLHHALNNDEDNNSQILNHAYEVRLVNNKLQWHTLEDDEYVILDSEPHMTPMERIGIGITSLLPIEGFL